MNVQFEYLYRDAGNFKNWNEIVFANPSNLPVETLNRRARQVLIDQSYFVAEKARVPDLHFPNHDSDLDHDWHEFHTITATDKPPDDQMGRTIEEFLKSIDVAAKF